MKGDEIDSNEIRKWDVHNFDLPKAFRDVVTTD